jgi:hypothetical protein
MIPNVVGLSLREATIKLEAAGSPAPEVVKAVVPADFRSRRPDDIRRKTEFVATQWESSEGGLRVLVVSVPSEPLSQPSVES